MTIDEKQLSPGLLWILRDASKHFLCKKLYIVLKIVFLNLKLIVVPFITWIEYRIYELVAETHETLFTAGDSAWHSF